MIIHCHPTEEDFEEYRDRFDTDLKTTRYLQAVSAWFCGVMYNCTVNIFDAFDFAKAVKLALEGSDKLEDTLKALDFLPTKYLVEAVAREAAQHA